MLATRVGKGFSETGVRVEREISAEKVNMSHFEKFDFRMLIRFELAHAARNCNRMF